MDIFQNTNYWVLFSFILFAFTAYKLGKDRVLGILDEKIEKIRKELETAETLRVEAQEMLAQYQRKQREAQTEADRIIRSAQEEAEKLREKAEADMQTLVMRREAWLEERLQRMEADALEDIQNKTSNLALEAATKALKANMNEKLHNALVKQTLENLPQKFH